ncbi:MAG TPA: PepSY-associated TM helix domain-containing protein [Bacteroidales bacterium]|nr:PepSY-associated TM helix domain-containing protein [Bacteroidales bacterium]
MNFSRLNRITHRDIGYFIAGLTIIYALSGITLNHKNDWNPNYVIDSRVFKTEKSVTRESFNDELARNILKEAHLEKSFKASYFPSGNTATIFIEGGLVRINITTGECSVERISKRPLFFQINFLHYNPGVLWKYFSDLFCVLLMLVTITGLFLVKGKNGITRRGAILTTIGIILPLIFLLIYL